MKSIKPIYNNNTLNKNTNTSFSVVDNFLTNKCLIGSFLGKLACAVFLVFFLVHFSWISKSNMLLGGNSIRVIWPNNLWISQKGTACILELYFNPKQYIFKLWSTGHIFKIVSRVFSKSFPGYFQKALLAFSSASFKDSAIASRHQIFLTEKYKDNVYQ